MAWGSRYIPGNQYTVCDLCGFKVRASKARFNHDGLLVCTKDWEPQHPQEYMVEHRAEKIVPDKVRTEPDEISVAPETTHPSAPTRSSNQVTADDL